MKLKKVIAAVSAAAMVMSCMPSVWAESDSDILEDSGVSIVPEDFTPVTCSVSTLGHNDTIEIINPWAEDTVLSEAEVPEKTKDLSVCFDVDYCDTVFKAWSAFAANEWQTYANEESDYDRIGGMPEFVINHNGSYEMIVPIGLFMENPPEGIKNEFEYIKSIIYMTMYIEGETDSSDATITITDIKAYEKSHTVEECSYVGEEDLVGEDDPVVDETSTPVEDDPIMDETEAPVESDPIVPIVGETYGFFRYQENEDGNLIIIGYNGEEKDVVIPSEINGKKVTGIGNRAFEDCTSLITVKIPDSVAEMGYRVFAGCTSLILVENIPVGNGFMSGMFDGCISLTSVEVPDGVTWIEPTTFGGCTSLTSVLIPNSVEAIGYEKGGEGNAFTNSPNVTIYGYTDSYAEEYAAKYEIPFISIDNSANIRINNGVEVSVPDDSDATLEDKTLEAELQDSNEKLISFNITLRDKEGNEVQPGGEITVKIPVPTHLNGEECNVYHKGTDGTYTDMNAVYENGCMVFTTNHFSEYVVSAENLVSNDEMTTAPETSVAGDTNNSDGSDKNSPDTGVAGVTAVAGIAAIAAAAIVIAKKRK